MQKDTIVGRSPNYYYSSWYDTCDFFYNGVENPSAYVRTALARYGTDRNNRLVHSDNTFGDTLRVKGLSCMVWMPDSSNYNPGVPTDEYLLSTDKLPEYMYLGSFDRKQNEFIIADSIRWDTVTPKLMMLPRHLDTSAGYERCLVYEVFFDQPRLVHGRFEIGGSLFSNLNDIRLFHYRPTFYVGIHYTEMHELFAPRCVNYYDSLDSSWVWLNRSARWSDHFALKTNPFHLIVQPKRWVDALPCDSVFGSVEGGGSHYDSNYVSLVAVPNRGYTFSHWNDGDTTNPRQVFVTSDTSFVAYFTPKAVYNVNAITSHPYLTSVSGVGVYYDGETATLGASNAVGLEFSSWDDGDTNNPRQVVVVSDTSFKAIYHLVGYQEIDGILPLEFTLTPNPAHEYVTVTTNREDSFQVSVRDESGRLLDAFRTHDSVFRLDLSALPAGVYYVTLKSEQGIGTQKVVKQ